MALAEGPTPNPSRVVVGMVLEEEPTERGIDQLVMEVARKRWNIKGAPMRETEVGRDAQAGLVLAECLVAAVGSRFCCVGSQSAPLEKGGLVVQSIVRAGNLWKDSMSELFSVRTNIGPGGGAKVRGKFSVHAVLALPTAHGKRVIWPGNTMVKVLKGGVGGACFLPSWAQQGPRSYTSWDSSGRRRFKIEPVIEMSSEVSSEFKRGPRRMFRKAHQGSPPGPFIRSGGRKADLIPEKREKPDACAPEQSSFENSHGGNEAEHSIGLLWSELKTPAKASLRAFRLGGRSALSKYRSVTHLWVLLSLPTMPGPDDGTTGARQRSLLPSPLREDSQLALSDFLNTGRTCPPAGGGEKAAFGGPGAQMAQPRSMSLLRVPDTDLVRCQSEAMEAISSLPLIGGCQCIFSGVRILCPVDMLKTPRQLALDSMKPEGLASVVVVFMAGAESSRIEPRVQLDDQEVWAWPKSKKGEFIPQPKGCTSLGQMNPVVAKLVYHGLSRCPEGPLLAEGKFGKSGSFGVRVQCEYCVVERSGLQFLMECKAKGSGSEALGWGITGLPALAALQQSERPGSSAPVPNLAAVVASFFLAGMTLQLFKFLRSITSVARGLLGASMARARFGAGREWPTVRAGSARSHPQSSQKLAQWSRWARAGGLRNTDTKGANVFPVDSVRGCLWALCCNVVHFLGEVASSMKKGRSCFSRAFLAWTCLIPGAFGQSGFPFGTSLAHDQCPPEGEPDRSALDYRGYVVDVVNDYLNDFLLLALFLVIVLLAYRAALVFGWHQGCRFILLRRAIRAERFEHLLEQKSEECNQRGLEILALQDHIRELRGHLSNAQPELLRALHEEQSKSRGLARELQLYEDSFFDKNQQLIALERHIRELQEVLRGYESLRRSGHRVMTRAYNELEHHHNRYHRHGEVFVANRGAVWHWDGTCYKLQNATVRELWPCTSCANDVMTPHIPDEYGVSLENSITGWLVSADTFDTSAVDRPLFPMEVDVTSGPASSIGAAGSSFFGF
eukprot:s412_g32.t1